MATTGEGAGVVVQPGEGESYWQPVPANGFVEVAVSGRRDPAVRGFETGTQTVDPGCHVREHRHDRHEELILVYEGNGTATVAGEAHVMQPGTTLYLPRGCVHTFANDGDAPLRFFWVLMPGGLATFFEAIGRPRTAGEPAPAPFPRPDNVEQIERETVFGPLD